MPIPNSPSRLRRRTLLLCLAALTGFSLVGIAAFRNGLHEPTYTFSCVELTDPVEVQKLLRFGDECERLQRWAPDAASDTAIEAVCEHLQSPDNHSAKQWSELYRGGSAPGFSVLNGAVALLATRIPDAELPGLRELPANTLRNRVRAEIDAVVQQQRDEALRERLRDPALEPLLARFGDKPYPQPPGAWRTWACSVWGQPIRDRERWAEALLDAVAAARPELDRIAGVYERIARTTEVMLSDSGLVLRRLRYVDPTLHSVRWEGDNTTADWTVWHRSAGEGGASIERDTGLRIQNLAVTKGDESWPNWPPLTVLAADEEFGTFMRALGFPDGLSVRTDSAYGEGGSMRRRLVVLLTVHSPDVTDWRWSGELRLAEGDCRVAVRTAAEQALADLRDYLPRAPAYRRLPVKFESTARDADTLTGCFTVGQAPPLRLRCRLNDDGRLSWLGPDNLRDLTALAPWLATRHAELAPVAERLVLGRIDPQQETGTLEGTLTVAGQPTPAVAWRLTSRGTTTFEIPDGWKDVSRRLGVSSPPMQPDKLEAVRTALEEELRQRHPLLARHAEVSTSLSGLCYVGVRIDDWPLLRLGPTAVQEPSEAGAALGRLLGEESVRRSAAIQWDRIDHPRYGTVRPEIAAWSADDAHATIHCVAPLRPESDSEVLVAWREKTWLNLDGWKRDTLDVSKQIEKARDGILERVNLLLGRRFGPSDYVLTVEPDTTDGAMGWLSLKPFSIKLRARLRVKPFDLVVVMGGARLDYAGLHLPDDYHLTLERTLPTPYCALSDPTLRVHLKKQSLALGCKVTPPLIPLAAAAGNGKPTVAQVQKAYGLPKGFPVLRLDNPWLHLIYLRGEFGGQLREPRLHAEADLRMLEFIDAAHGTAVLIPREYRLEAQLRVGTPVSARVGLPMQLDGDVLFTPALTRLQGKVRLAGLAAADATFRVVSREEPARFRLDVGAEVPVLGLVHLSGETDLTLTTYQLRGEGRLTASWLNGEGLHYVVEMHDGRMLVDFRREKAGKVVRFRVEGPDAAALDEALLRDRLKGLREEEIREPSTAELQLAARFPVTESGPLPPAPSEEASGNVTVRAEPAAQATPGAPRSVANVECFGPPGGASWQFRYYDAHDQVKDVGYALKSKVMFDHPRDCVFRSWLDPQYVDRFTTTLAFDQKKKQVTLMLWEAGWVKTVTDVTGRFAALGELFPTGKDAQLQSEMVQDFIATHTDLTLRGNRMAGDVRRVGGGFLLEYEPKGLPDRLNAVFTWRADRGAYTARLFEPFVPRKVRDEALYARLETLRPQRRNLLVVAVEGGSTGRIATLEPVGGRAWDLRPEAKKDKIALKELDGPALPLPELAHRVALAVWRRDLPSGAAHGVLVPGGALLSSKEGFWLLPASSLLNREWSERPFFVQWDAFRRWEADSVRLLHPDWRSAKARAAATPELIAQTFLRDWDALREKEPGWAANPLGLLIGLSERKQEVARGR